MQYRPRCGWRHRLVRRTTDLVLRKCLMGVLVLECVIGAAQMFGNRIPGIPVVRMEESGNVEWFLPGEEDQPGTYEVFGIQFRLEDGEIRFYRSRQEIKSH